MSALRGQLEKVEQSFEIDRASVAEALRLNGEEVDRAEARLTELGGRFVEPLRVRRDLGDLFARLEREGTPAAGVPRPG